MALALSKASVSDWQTQAHSWLYALPGKRRFTSEDLVDAVGLPTGAEASGKNNAVGAVMNAAAKKGVIRNTHDYVKTKRPASHGRIIAVWERTLLGKEPNVYSSTPVPVPTDASPDCPECGDKLVRHLTDDCAYGCLRCGWSA